MLVAQDSDYLLLDEPISALDIAYQIEIMELVRTLSRERGLGVVIVLHDINMAVRFCDPLVALRGGKIIAQGAPGALMPDEVLTEMFGIPMGTIPNQIGRSSGRARSVLYV